MEPRSDSVEEVCVKDALFMTMKHFFPSFSNWLKTPADPRDKDKITYPLQFILWASILMFMTKLKARRQVNFWFNTSEVISNLNALSGTELEKMAHDTTMANLLERINPYEIARIIIRMIRTLIRMRCLEKFRLLGMYYLIGVDGTGHLAFPERHCEHCLVRKTDNGKVIYYYHNVLDAKLITSNGMALSVMTEFIENENDNLSKQDCELRAFYRMAGRLKTSFPQLKICLLMDSLYPGEPVFKICRKNNWKFMITFKEGSMSAFYGGYLFLKRIGGVESACVGKDRLKQDYAWINDMDYKSEYSLSILECAESKPGEKSGEDTRFVWLTNLKINENNYKQIAEGGRLRWKIENEGFNMQKNGGYNLEHAYSLNAVAAKNLYLLMQVAHTINQLMEKGSLLREHIQKVFGSVRNVARKLLKELRTSPTEPAHLEALPCVQIRFALFSRPPP